MRFSVLGLVGITDGLDSVVLPTSKPSSLLAALLLRPNQAVSIDFLQNAVWEDNPPPTAKATLQTYVLRLRRLFRNFGISDNLIETVPNGYRFPATSDTLDLVEFRALAALARSQRGEAGEYETLGRALTLWQGPPLSNIQSTMLQRDEVPGLVEEWLRLSERRFDVALDLGLHGEITGELRAATRAYPGYERFSEQLIEALYQCGRQADALREYAFIKHYLSTELGVDPGPGLQKLEMAVLRGTELPPRATPTGPPVVPAPVLTSLPPDLPRFCGRQQETDQLVGYLTAPRSGPLVVVVSGPPGSGKTALAVHVAHLVADRFPDGCAALSLDEAVANPYPARHRGLLLIDGVTDARQVLPILPDAPGSATILVSRATLTGLVAARGGHTLRLGALQAGDAHEFLTTTLGADRIGAEPQAMAELAELCGYYPVALRIVLSRLTASHRNVGDCVEWLRPDPIRKLSLTPDRTLSLVSLFGDYLAGLSPAVVSTYYALGRAGGDRPTEWSVSECALLLDLTPYETEHALEQLVDASLLEIGSGGRYVLTPLLAKLSSVLADAELVGSTAGTR